MTMPVEMIFDKAMTVIFGKCAEKYENGNAKSF